MARDFCESCHSGSLGRPGLEGSTILGKRKSKNCLQQRGVVCEIVATTLIGACTQVPPYHCIWSSHEHMAAGLEGYSILGKIKSKNSLKRYGVLHPYPLRSQWRSVHQDFSWAGSQPMTSRLPWNSCKITQKSSFFVIFGLAPTFVACALQPQIEAPFLDLRRF